MSKILFWDIETSPIIAAVWGLYDQTIQYSSVIQDWHVICAAWKWEGEEIKSISCNGTDDKNVIKKLHSLISDADAIVAHNGNNFDWKKFMSRVVYHGLPPVPQPVMVDTLLQARKYKFTSNKLDDLGTHLKTGNKVVTDRGLWVKAAQGHKASIKALETYCRGDIPPLEGLYYKLRPYASTGFNIGHYNMKPCCPKCGSESYQSRGTEKTKNSMHQRFQCNGCHAWFKSGKRDRGIVMR